MPKAIVDNKFSSKENKAVLGALHKLMKQNGYSYQELSRLSAVSMGGMIGLRKMTEITPNIANKLALAFDYSNWHDLLKGADKNRDKTLGEPSLKARIQRMEKRIKQLEQDVRELNKAVKSKKRLTGKNV